MWHAEIRRITSGLCWRRCCRHSRCGVSSGGITSRSSNAICWVKRTGSPWRDLPERYRPWKTAYQRFRRWGGDGTWASLKAHAIALAELDDDIDWDAQVDATIVRTHQHAAGARKGG